METQDKIKLEDEMIERWVESVDPEELEFYIEQLRNRFRQNKFEKDKEKLENVK